jgi:hypothetical protein
MTRADLIEAYKQAGHISSSELLRLTKPGAAGTAEDQIIERAMDAVLPEFSRNLPYKTIAELTNDVTAKALCGWNEDSNVTFVEYPVGEHPRQPLSLRNVYVDEDAGTIFFTTVGNGESVNVTYTVMHVISADTDPITIPISRMEAFLCLTSKRLADVIAASYASSVQPGGGESVNYRTQSDQWRSMAKEFGIRYRELIGAPEKPQTPAAEFSVEYEQPDHRIFSVDSSIWP